MIIALVLAAQMITCTKPVHHQLHNEGKYEWVKHATTTRCTGRIK